MKWLPLGFISVSNRSPHSQNKPHIRVAAARIGKDPHRRRQRQGFKWVTSDRRSEPHCGVAGAKCGFRRSRPGSSHCSPRDIRVIFRKNGLRGFGRRRQPIKTCEKLRFNQDFSMFSQSTYSYVLAAKNIRKMHS